MKFNKDKFVSKELNNQSYLKEGVVNFISINSFFKSKDGDGLSIVLYSEESIIKTSDNAYEMSHKHVEVSGDDQYEFTVIPVIKFGNAILMNTETLTNEAKKKIASRFDGSSFMGRIKAVEMLKINAYSPEDVQLKLVGKDSIQSYKDYLIALEKYELLHELLSWDPSKEQLEDKEDAITITDKQYVEVNESILQWYSSSRGISWDPNDMGKL